MTKSKTINFLTMTAILLCIASAIWSRETLKWSLSAAYMIGIRYWFYKPRTVIGEELDVRY